MATTSKANRPFSERLFRCVLRLFPSEFREQFAGEMETVFRDQHRDARSAGPITHARFWWETYSGIIVTAFREHRDILFQDASGNVSTWLMNDSTIAGGGSLGAASGFTVLAARHGVAEAEKVRH